MTQESNPQSVAADSYATHAVIYAKGIAMGMGDSVPGISGGTIAVITHIYDKLIFSIRAVDLHAVRLLVSGQPGQAWKYINGNFLLALALGILSGLVLSANTVLYLLDNSFEALMAFFIGLVLASCWLLRHECDLHAWPNLVALGIGAIFTIAIGLLPAVTGNFSLPAIFFSGAIAICAMILPGLSGAFVLLLLGVYEYVLTALIEINLPVILVFMLGCIVGLLAFSRVLAWVLSKYHELSYGFIIGMLLGSLSVLWPWQYTQSAFNASTGEPHTLRTLNVWPAQYTELTGQAPEIGLVVAGLLVGGMLVLGLHRLFAQIGNSVPPDTAAPDAGSTK